jgi:hypothetical protein
VKFGISPFGIGKPEKRPAGIAGFSQYDKLYADAELWLQKGWLDYFTPQLYWPIKQTPQAYGVLLDYWAKENTAGRHLWPGLFTSRINDTPASWVPDEIINQLALTREKRNTDTKVSGHVHFSMVTLTQNRKGVSDQLKDKLYQTPALVPASPWLSSKPPPPPTVTLRRDADRPNKVVVSVARAAGDKVANYVVWTLAAGEWRMSVLYAGDDTAAVNVNEWLYDELAGLPTLVVVTSVDRFGNESAPVKLAQESLTQAKVVAWKQ